MRIVPFRIPDRHTYSIIRRVSDRVQGVLFVFYREIFRRNRILYRDALFAEIRREELLDISS